MQCRASAPDRVLSPFHIHNRERSIEDMAITTYAFGRAAAAGRAANTRCERPSARRATPISSTARCDLKPEQLAMTRRNALQLALGSAWLSGSLVLPALAEKTPKGFVGVRDKGDGYQFFYPFGWQEVSVPGQDVVYKDVIEPLESVSVSVLDTDKTGITDYGDVNEVCFTLADKVLTAPSQAVELVQAKEDTFEGVTYYTMEFKVTASNYNRHALAVITVNNGKFYTLLTGCNERRWTKVQDKLKQMVGSFSTFKIVE